MQLEDIIIISPDKDFIQLQQGTNIEQIDIIHKMRKVKAPNPAKVLKKKFIYGDRKDGIPNIKSDETDIAKGVHQKAIQRAEFEPS